MLKIEAEYKIQEVGKIDNLGRVDQYFQIIRFDDDLNLDDTHNWLLEQHYYDTNRPGGWFCHSVTICPNPYRADTCIGIVHHLQNV